MQCWNLQAVFLAVAAHLQSCEGAGGAHLWGADGHQGSWRYLREQNQTQGPPGVPSPPMAEQRSLLIGPSGPCLSSILRILEPATMRDFYTCIDEKFETNDMTVAGVGFAIQHECWCKHKVQEVIGDAFGCCQHEDFALLCAANCTPDCSAPAAETCKEECPALCLEHDYAPEGCVQRCNEHGCAEHMKCIVQHSQEMTDLGQHENICDDAEFEGSPEFGEWAGCMLQHPRRTHWHRWNAEWHCYCQSNLKAAAERHGCCEAHWGKHICDVSCKTEAECGTAEATVCLEGCKDTCSKLYKEEATADCLEQCRGPNAACDQFKTCAPVGHFDFSYVCDDGSKPGDNGCCQGRRGLTCPALCDSGKGHLMSHGPECECFDCPEGQLESSTKLNRTLQSDLYDNGQNILADIAKRIGLPYPTKEMNELMLKRNQDILDAVNEHESKLLDQVLQNKIDAIALDYQKKIEDAGQKALDCGDSCDDDTEDNDEDGNGDGDADKSGKKRKGKGGGDDSSNTGVIIGVAAGAGGMLILGAVVAFCFFRRKKAANPGATAGGGTEPIENDTNVVVGRPVQGGAMDSAVGGAPVQPAGTSAAKRGGSEESNDNDQDKDQAKGSGSQESNDKDQV